MYLAKMSIENFRCFGSGADRFEIAFNPGLTALVGENDSGKTAVIDAIRLVLGTTDQEWFRIEDSDFHSDSNYIAISCRFENLASSEKSAFVEHLTYANSGNDVSFTVIWTAKKSGKFYHGRPYHIVETMTGDDGSGPSLDPNIKMLLQATYLRPLRDAEQALSAGRGSRLAQILNYAKEIRTGESDYVDGGDVNALNVLGISKLLNALLKKQDGVVTESQNIDANLGSLALEDERLECSIGVSGENAVDDFKRIQLLEKLDLTLKGDGKMGLGSENLLFIACELILLAQDTETNKLLLMEEPEAHLHPQRQLQVMQYLQEKAAKDHIQILITTHSPNLASAILLDHLILIHDRKAFPLRRGQTKLAESDYQFLERFLDVTKANLFFARSVLIVEGDAENILIPALARALGRDFTRYGVSVVNVGGIGLGRYARIFQRTGSADGDKKSQLDVRVACVTDMDVMPDSAPEILGKVTKGDSWPEKSPRRWRAKRDFLPSELAARRTEKIVRIEGQYVKAFIADEWTFEYDLAYAGMAEDVYICACLAEYDDEICEGKKQLHNIITDAMTEYGNIATMNEEERCSHIYGIFESNKASKTIAAQYLAARVESKTNDGSLTIPGLHAILPKYIVDAIEYVTADVYEGC